MLDRLLQGQRGRGGVRLRVYPDLVLILNSEGTRTQEVLAAAAEALNVFYSAEETIDVYETHQQRIFT